MKPSIFLAVCFAFSCGVVGSDEPLPGGRFTLTDVKVRPIERTRNDDGQISDAVSDKLTYWVRFDVQPTFTVEKSPVFSIVDPIDERKTRLTFDKPIRFEGKIVPAGTNLLDYKKFDGSFFNVSVPKPNPLAIQSATIKSGFQIPADSYAVSFEWTTASGKVLSSTVKVVIDVPGLQPETPQDVSLVTDDEGGVATHAARRMRRYDANGDGQIEKSEVEREWRRLRRLDANQDDRLTLDELKAEPIQYLDSAGPKKLNLRYKQLPNKDLHLDLYYPAEKSAAGWPVVIYTHGGGWAAGSKQGAAKASFAVVFQRLLKQGFAVASVNYRLWRPEGTVSMRDCVVDSKDAVRFLAKNNAALELDPQQFFVMGDSAGGQIAQMLLLSSADSLPGDAELIGTEYKMLAGVSWYGPCDFEHADLFNHDDRPDFRDRFGPRILKPDSDPNDKLRLYREMSPVNYVSADTPPLLLIQGDKDTTIPVKHAYFMKTKADAVAAPIEIMIVQNAGHNWRKVDADIQPTRETIIERTVQFFVDHRPSPAKRD